MWGAGNGSARPASQWGGRAGGSAPASPAPLPLAAPSGPATAARRRGTWSSATARRSPPRRNRLPPAPLPPPPSPAARSARRWRRAPRPRRPRSTTAACRDRKSTRLTPVTNAHLVCRLLLEKKNRKLKHRNREDKHTDPILEQVQT